MRPRILVPSTSNGPLVSSIVLYAALFHGIITVRDAGSDWLLVAVQAQFWDWTMPNILWS